MGKFKCDSCFHKKVCQESPAYGTVMEDCPSYINVEIDNSLQQLKAEILPMLCEASESLHIGDLEDGERIINEITAKLSAV